jgi:cyclopropane-fatty-acyl-phospholipid synthase
MRVVAPQLSDRAAGVLRQVFADVPAAFAFRLWDGTLVSFGSGAPAFTVVIHAPDTFMRLMRDPTPLTFGEAYVQSTIDIEGDLFAAMHVANTLEEIRIPLAQRLRLLLSLGPAALRPSRPHHA